MSKAEIESGKIGVDAYPIESNIVVGRRIKGDCRGDQREQSGHADQRHDGLEW